MRFVHPPYFIYLVVIDFVANVHLFCLIFFFFCASTFMTEFNQDCYIKFDLYLNLNEIVHEVCMISCS